MSCQTCPAFPQFKVKNKMTGKFLTADGGADSDVKHMADDGSDNQKW